MDLLFYEILLNLTFSNHCSIQIKRLIGNLTNSPNGRTRQQSCLWKLKSNLPERAMATEFTPPKGFSVSLALVPNNFSR